MTKLFCSAALAGAALVIATGASTPARADVADFYKGKTVTILVAFGAGGGYGLYGRTLSEHLSKHIPGNPTIVAQFMPGAGGAKMANYFYNVSPKDGTVIGMPSNSHALAQVLQPERIKYDAAKFNYIGRMVDMRSAIIVWHTAGVKTLQDMMTEEVIFGSTGKSSQDYMNPMLMKNVLGAKVKMVMGYKGSSEINLAMEKGEVQAMANSWGSVKARLGRWLQEDLIDVVAMVGLTPAPDARDVPLVLNQTEDPEERAILELMASTTEVGRAFNLPPEVPEDRIAALRAAFKATMEDPDFLAAAKKRKMDLEYLSGEDVQKVVLKTVKTPEQIVQRFREAIELEK